MAAGLRKVNVGMASNVGFTAAIRKRLTNEKIIDPRGYLAEARDVVTSTAAHFIRVVSGLGLR